jgi:hypothetical protein
MRRGGTTAGSQDALKDDEEVALHIVVADAKDVKPSSGKNMVAFGIVGQLTGMGQPIHFNDEPGVGAIEVDNEAVDHLLPAEV